MEKLVAPALCLLLVTSLPHLIQALASDPSSHDGQLLSAWLEGSASSYETTQARAVMGSL
jgi:hypothetical protein